jgi:hypothetical protein
MLPLALKAPTARIPVPARGALWKIASVLAVGVMAALIRQLECDRAPIRVGSAPP